MVPQHEVSSLPPAVLQAYPARYFIETGTNTGKGVDVALAHTPPYEIIWSCERDATLWRAIWSRFTDASPVRLVHGDSPTFLQQVLYTLPDPAFIYLDAHTEDQNPLLEELAMIAAAPPGLAHIIAIDDVRMFGRQDMLGWAHVTMHDVVQALYRINPFYTLRYWDTVNAPGDLLVAALNHPTVTR